jgi:hypothetical protein
MVFQLHGENIAGEGRLPKEEWNGSDG